MRRVGPLLTLGAGAILLAAAFTTSVRASGTPFAPPPWLADARSAAEAQGAKAADAGNYVGPGSCSAVACHGAVRPGSGRILQTEYSTWIARDRHARATEVLSSAVSRRMAEILDLGAPQQAQRCLACHALDVPAAARGRTFATEGVSCEA